MYKQSQNSVRRTSARSHRNGREWPFDGDADAETAVRECDHPDCAEAGIHRAPRSPEALDSFYWFCLDHVRDYNRAWNYYANMSDAEVETERRKDTFWHRPTWPLGGKGGFRDELRDPFGFFRPDPKDSRNEDPAYAAFRENSPELAALAIMDLKPPLTIPILKSRYKDLVKRYHPDANVGDKQAEDRLKDINQAYATLMRSLGS